MDTASIHRTMYVDEYPFPEQIIKSMVAHKIIDIADTLETTHTFEDGGYIINTEVAEYRVMTEDAAVNLAQEYLAEHIEEALCQVPKHIQEYVDKKKWVNDVIAHDGLGHTLAHYDGEEHEFLMGDTWYYAFRID